MISITTLLFSHYKLIISLVAIIPIIIGIYGLIKFSWTKIITSIIILILLFGSFFFLGKKEPSSKYASKAVSYFDETIDKYNNLLNNYDGSNSKLLNEANKIQAELKELYESVKLTQEEKAKIKKALDDNKNKIEEIENKSKDGEKNICILNGELINLEQQKAIKEAEIKKKEEELAKTQDQEIRKQLQNEISNLQDERMEIIKKIQKNKMEIKKLESKKTMYQDILKRAQNFKKQLDKDYDNLTTGEKTLFSKIKTKEERFQQIQTKITNNENNKKEIQKKIDEILIERQMADQCRLACDDWDKEHELSFGNVRDAIFDGFDKYTDYATGRLFLKTGANTTKKGADFITKTALYFYEGNKFLESLKQAYFNNDEKETPKKMTKETYDAICARTDSDYKKYGDQFTKCQTEIDTLLEEQKDKNLIEAEDTEKEQVKSIQKRNELELKEYSKTIDELNEKLIEVSSIDDKLQLQEQLEEIKVQQDELINATKEELRSKSPSFNTRNNRAKNMRYTRYGLGSTTKK